MRHILAVVNSEWQANLPLLLEGFVQIIISCRWETGSPIPGLPLETPDHSYNLFHQKLQLVNCCIERKRARERRERGEEGVKLEQSEDEEEDIKGELIS